MKIICLLSLLFLITSCSLHTPYAVEPITIPADFKESINVNNTELKSNWWENFDDQNLNALVDVALENNLNYQMSLNNVAMAKDYAKSSKVILSELFSPAGHDAETQLQIVAANSRMAKLTLVTEVTTIYFQIATLNTNIDNLHKQQAIANALLKTATIQYDIGYIDSTTLSEATINVKSISNNMQNLQKQQKTYTNQLADLLGKYPEDFHAPIYVIKNGSNLQQLIPAAEPAQVLANRPDIQAAYLPLTTNFSTKAQHAQAQLNYQATVHHAFQEVDNALLAFKQDHTAYLATQTIVKNLTEDYNSATIQYKAGQIDNADNLRAKFRLLQAQYDLTQQNLLLYSDIIQIYKALGI